MGQATHKMCHTQEIAFEPFHDEWRPVDEWSEDISQGQHCEPAGDNCRLCCRPGESHVEEVLVVHHEALQKVDFLLKHDELNSCEAPVVPECVTAVRRAKILKRLWTQQRRNAGSEEIGGYGHNVSASTPRDALLPCLEDGDDGDPSDEELGHTAGGSESSSKVTNVPHRRLEQRLPKGLQMWTLSRGPDRQILQQAVLMQKLDWDSPVLRITGEQIQTVFPLANVKCVELVSNADGRASEKGTSPRRTAMDAFREEEQTVFVYLKAKRDQTKGFHEVGEKTHHFAFQSAQDAEDFRSWMRTFYPSQVVSASDCDPVPDS